MPNLMSNCLLNGFRVVVRVVSLIERVVPVGGSSLWIVSIDLRGIDIRVGHGTWNAAGSATNARGSPVITENLWYISDPDGVDALGTRNVLTW